MVWLIIGLRSVWTPHRIFGRLGITKSRDERGYGRVCSITQKLESASRAAPNLRIVVSQRFGQRIDGRRVNLGEGSSGVLTRLLFGSGECGNQGRHRLSRHGTDFRECRGRHDSDLRIG
jgi:hypothetical protein